MLELFGKIISIVQHSLESQETSMTQIDPINWQLALLTQNPFPDTPPSRPEDTVWAGFPDLKNNSICCSQKPSLRRRLKLF
jgi:hypothetical protein